jgi:hypothetical protein
MATTIPVIARVQRNLKSTLEEAARAAGLSLETFSGQLLENAAAEFRLLRISPAQDFLAPCDDDDLDENRRKPRRTLSAAEETDVVRSFNSGLRGPELATRFGISQPTVYRILSRRVPDRPRQIHRRRKATNDDQGPATTD